MIDRSRVDKTTRFVRSYGRFRYLQGWTTSPDTFNPTFQASPRTRRYRLPVYYNPRNPRAQQLSSYPPSPYSPPRSVARHTMHLPYRQWFIHYPTGSNERHTCPCDCVHPLFRLAETSRCTIPHPIVNPEPLRDQDGIPRVCPSN